MKFNVLRTSGYNKISPCKNAVLVEHSESKYERDYWEVNINSIEKLLDLVEEVREEIIISPKLLDCEKHDYSIEIYDAHRE